MIGHLGTHVSALLDGQLSVLEEERAWAHVHVCPECRREVEHQGWVKTRLMGLSVDAGAPATLKGSLLGAPVLAPVAPPVSPGPDSRRRVTLSALSGGAVGAAVVGVIALGAAPASAPAPDRRLPTTTSLVRPVQGPPSVGGTSVTSSVTTPVSSTTDRGHPRGAGAALKMGW